MNFTHVLSWGSSFSSSSLLECRRRRADETGLGQSLREVVRDPQQPKSSTAFVPVGLGQTLREVVRDPEQPRSSTAFVAVVCRGSNGDSRRSSGYGRGTSSTSSSSRGSNAVSSRPRGPREQNNDKDSSDRNSDRSRENYGRYGASDDDRRNESRYNNRDSGRRYGAGKGYRGGRGGGGGGGRGGSRDRIKQMHPGAYKMLDEETGQPMVVWGVEDDDEIPVPTAAELKWKNATMALPGDASEETWGKVLEQQIGSSGSYRVRGAEVGRKDWMENLFEEDPEDDFEDDDILDDEDDSDSDFEEPIENPKVAISRAPRVKVFGRDFGGKSLIKVKTPEEDKTDVASEPVVKSEAVPSSGIRGAADVQKQDPVAEAGTILGYSGVIASPDNIDERNSQAFTSGNNTAEGEIGIDLKDADNVSQGRRRTSKLDKKSVEMERSTASKIDNRPLEKSRAVITNDTFTEASSKGPTVDEDKSAGGRNMALKIDDGSAEGSGEASPGSFNPFIIDISEKDDRRSQLKHEANVRKSGLLDRLRLQVAGQKQTSEDGVQKVVHDDSEDAPSATTTAEVAPKTSVDDSIRPPMRDLTARDNYDASIANEFFSLKSFKDIGASPEVIQALSYLNVQRPSQIQAMSFKPIVDGKSCIIAEQTGSGKTLAYVAPIVQRLRADEARTLGKSLSKKPRVLVLVPTGELAAQVLSNFRSLSKGGVPCRAIVVTGGFKWKTQVESLEGGADVVVATPGRLLQQLDAGNIQFDNLKSVVLDEVDILFDDEDFSKALRTINKAASIKVQYIHVTATLPVDIHDDLLERYPDCLSLMGPSLHRTAIGLQEILVDCSGGETDDKTPESAFINKRTALLQLVEERPVAKTIIFCNKMETCRKVENVLSRYDRSGRKITVLPYHAALSQEARLDSLETFMKSQPKERLFLVCTDRASRGIDSLDVEHVVLFDFPRDPSEYVRRVGRTARGAGGTGKVFAFVVGRQVGHARRIMARNDKGQPVHDVPGSRYYYTN